jgi:hypothetical protein
MGKSIVCGGLRQRALVCTRSFLHILASMRGRPNHGGIVKSGDLDLLESGSVP